MRALLQSLFGDALARVLSGAGMSVLSVAAILPIVTAALNLCASHMSGLPSDVASLMLLSGAGESVSIIGSAVLTRVAVNAAQVGISKGSQS